MVPKFELPKVQDLQFITIPYDKGCDNLEDVKTKGRYPLGLIEEVKECCVKTAPHLANYKKQIEYYNQTAHEILTNEQKRGILTSLITFLLVWPMKVFLVFYIIKDKKL